jgi:hypothetical protein
MEGAPDPNSGSGAGVVVHLVADGQDVSGPVTALLTNEDGTITEVHLLDDGNTPDVFAGDMRFAAASPIYGLSFDVSLSFGDDVLEVGAISWKPEDTRRDLLITMSGGSLTMETSVPTDAGNMGDSQVSPGSNAGGGGVGGGGGGGMGAPMVGVQEGSGARPPTVTFPTGGSAETDALLNLGIGLGLLALAGLGLYWVWTRGSRSPEVPKGVVLLPEPGLLGVGTPSLSDGLCQWVVPSSEWAELTGPLLAHLARHHRVLVAAPTRIEVPLVHGGPVYRMTGMRPAWVGDAAEELYDDPGAPLVVLLFTDVEEVDTIRDFADLLPPEVGGVLVLGSDLPTSLATVHCRRDGGGWKATAGGAEYHLDEADQGFRIVGGGTSSAGGEGSGGEEATTA